jgi:cell division protein FtsI/penicillin-binding protein 2
MVALACAVWLAGSGPFASVAGAASKLPAKKASAASRGAAPPQDASSSARPATKAKKPAAKKPRTYTRNGIPTYTDPTENDIPEFDDPVVRDVAVRALGNLNGTIVVVDPTSGRILSIVNQKLAFSGGFQPCSTFKPVVALAALSEGIITRDTMIKVSRRKYLNLTDAMAHSDNPYFEVLGRQMGFETVSRYARLMGLGETAGLNIFEEHPGGLPDVPPQWGGVGKMSSFGEGILLTPLQLAAIGMTLGNGGTMYYLQYPRNDAERQHFEPRVKRKLNIEALLPDLREGMMAAVLYGTGRRSFEPYGEQLFGKTGTCSDQGSRLGWFVAHNDPLHPRMVVAVLLRGHRRLIGGSTAADIAGRVFQSLHERNYFARSAESSATSMSSSNR